MRYRVRNLTRNTVLCDAMEEAATFGSRFMGLMGRTDFPPGAGLHIAPCTSIHTFFMKIPIDVLFLTRDLTVVDALDAMPAWRMSRVYFEARSVLELPAGTMRATQTAPGDQLAMEPINL